MKKKNTLIIIFCLILIFASQTFSQYKDFDRPNKNNYGLGKWTEDTLGNYRVVIKVNNKRDAVLAHIPWRRSDKYPASKEFLIIDAKTNKQIDNKFLVYSNQEYGDIVFQPVTIPGEYYIYYLPYLHEGMAYWGDIKYMTLTNCTDANWLKKNSLDRITSAVLKKIPVAEIIQFQYKDSINAMFPMEVIAT